MWGEGGWVGGWVGGGGVIMDGGVGNNEWRG